MCALAVHMWVHTLDDGEEMNEASYTRSNSKYDKSEAEFSCSYWRKNVWMYGESFHRKTELDSFICLNGIIQDAASILSVV